MVTVSAATTQFPVVRSSPCWKKDSSSFCSFRVPDIRSCSFDAWSGLKNLGMSSPSSVEIKESKHGCRSSSRRRMLMVHGSLYEVGAGAPEALVVSVVALLVFLPNGIAMMIDTVGSQWKEFSMLPFSSDIPWNDDDIWSIFGAYLFILHIPLSFGGIAVVSMLLHQPVLDPSTKVISAIMLQSVEFGCAMLLLNYTSKAQFRFSNIFKDQLVSRRRSWLKATIVGLGSLFLIILLTSFLADILLGRKDVNDHILREIIVSDSLSSKVSSVFFCCFSTPLLEELVYRRFLLRSLASTMKWQNAILTSACVFSIAHFSSENAIQLFLIGSVLGAVYCWSGNLASSVVTHSVYNIAILVITSLI